MRILSVVVVAALVTATEPIQDSMAGEPWPRHTVDDTSRGADGVRLADVNRDGLADLVTGWEEGAVIRVYRNPGPEGVKSPWPRVTVGRVKSPEDAVFADLDADGLMDVVSACEGGNRSLYVHWAPQAGDDYFEPLGWTTERVPVPQKKQQWMFTLPMQIDGQNGVDLVVGSKGSGASIGWLQSPRNPRRLGDWTYHRWYDAHWIMSLEPHDVDSDGDVDVIASDRKGDSRGVLWIENPGAAATRDNPNWTVHRMGADGLEVMFLDVVDVDRDGRHDVLAAIKPDAVVLLRATQNPRSPWRQHSIRLPQTVGGLQTGTTKSVRAADVDRDGKIDLVITCENANGAKTGAFWMSYRGGLTGTWDAHPIGGPDGIKYDLIQLLDLDADGDLDLLTCEERDFNAVLWYENPTVP